MRWPFSPAERDRCVGEHINDIAIQITHSQARLHPIEFGVPCALGQLLSFGCVRVCVSGLVATASPRVGRDVRVHGEWHAYIDLKASGPYARARTLATHAHVHTVSPPVEEFNATEGPPTLAPPST